MMQRRLACLAALATIVMIGCDDAAGELFHGKQFWVVPDPTCVEERLRKIADDGRVMAVVTDIPIGANHGYERRYEVNLPETV